MEYYYESDGDDDTQSGLGRRGYGGVSRVYIGSHDQKGHGIGSFLGGLFRRALPLLTRGAKVLGKVALKKGAKAIGKEALRAGVSAAGDIFHKQISPKEAFSTRLRESGRNLKRKAEEKIDSLMHGSGYKTRKLSRVKHSRSGRVTKRVAARKRKPTKRPVQRRKKKANKKKKKKNSRTVADIFG